MDETSPAYMWSMTLGRSLISNAGLMLGSNTRNQRSSESLAQLDTLGNRSERWLRKHTLKLELIHTDKHEGSLVTTSEQAHVLQQGVRAPSAVSTYPHGVA